jgi:ferritin
MALNKKVEEEINKQINAELHSAYLYLSMSAYFEAQGLAGFANWMKIQWQEEITHAMKFFDYVNDRGGRVLLQPIAAVEQQWDRPLQAFEATLEHEQKVTSLINNLYEVALDAKDHATASMLKWFIDEQVEEEANAQEIIDNLRMVEGKGNGLFMIDREMKQRTFVDETQEE